MLVRVLHRVLIAKFAWLKLYKIKFWEKPLLNWRIPETHFAREECNGKYETIHRWWERIPYFHTNTKIKLRYKYNTHDLNVSSTLSCYLLLWICFVFYSIIILAYVQNRKIAIQHLWYVGWVNLHLSNYKFANDNDNEISLITWVFYI